VRYRHIVLSDFYSEIEESYLLVRHFYLPKGTANTILYINTGATLLPKAAFTPEATTLPRTCPAEPLRVGEYNPHVCQVCACEVHAYEVYAHEMHACEVYTREVHA
jgi:hypothetical protein